MKRGSELLAGREAEDLPPAETLHIEELHRQATFGRLASGLIHDVNQPATLGMMSSTELVRCIAELSSELTDAPAGVQASLRQVEALTSELALAMQHLCGLVRDARSLGGPTQRVLQTLDPNQVVESACRLVRRDVEEHAELRQALGSVRPILGEPVRLTQVFVNLLLNAGHAVKNRPEGAGRVWIATRSSETGVVIEVVDDGCGIAPSMRSKLFHPFVSSRQAEGGMGLGLWMCAMIVKAHEGKIDFESVVGRGTRFIVELPAAPE